MRKVLLVLLVLIVLVFIPNPLYWNIRLVDVLHNFGLKGLHMSGWHPLNLEQCQKNLFEFDDVMKAYGIQYWLSEGTALGAVRDGALIPWDDDVDTGMMESQRDTFIKQALPDLISRGFKVTYVESQAHFFGLLRGNEKVDVDIVSAGGKCRACRTSAAMCKSCDDMRPFLGGMRSVHFLGRDFFVPGNDYLEYLYGDTWGTPIKKKDIVI